MQCLAIYESEMAADSIDATVPGGSAGICWLWLTGEQMLESSVALGDAGSLELIILASAEQGHLVPKSRPWGGD